jgi:DNA invertase Pin-like site-specific DNA recombinase
MDAKPTGKMIGYARVSTEDQELRVQLDALEKAGCWNVYQEKRSASKGKRRPQLELALMDLRPGDTLVVWRLDRLVRNARDMYTLLDRVTAAGANFKSLQEGYDFTTPMGQFVLGLLGLLAQLEAQWTSQRTSAGIRAIQERGLRYGAQPKLSKARAEQLVRMRKAGASRAETARKFEVSTGTVRNYELRATKRKRRK